MAHRVRAEASAPFSGLGEDHGGDAGGGERLRGSVADDHGLWRRTARVVFVFPGWEGMGEGLNLHKTSTLLRGNQKKP